MRRNKIPTRYLYCVQCHGYLKFGVSNDVKFRIGMMQTGNPFRISLAGILEFTSYDPEREIHNILEAYNVRDDPTSLRKAFIEASEKADVLISSGGVSVVMLKMQVTV